VETVHVIVFKLLSVVADIINPSDVKQS